MKTIVFYPSTTSLGLILFCFLFNYSCQKYDLDQWPISYPKSVEKEIKLFLDYAPKDLELKPLTIQLTGEIYLDGKKVVGLCQHSKKRILLDTTSDKYKYGRTRLVMHELGHYTMQREHLDDTITLFNTWVGFPVSFMNSCRAKPTDWNLKNPVLLEYYMNELFEL